jgi:tetratricopeptide (TPR) repeat protein
MMTIEHPEKLADFLKQHHADPANTVLFIGAGLSMPIFPSWQELLQEMIKRSSLHEEHKKNYYKFIETGEHYLQIADECWSNSIDHCWDLLKEVFTRKSITPEKVPNYREILTNNKLGVKTIITTNYDRIPDKLGGSNWDYLGNNKGAIATAQADLGKMLQVIKIHGDIHSQETLILTETQYQQLTHRPDIRNFLTTVFSTKRVLFLGFGLTDPHIIPIIKDIKAIYSVHPQRHYAFMPIFDPDAKKLAEKKAEVRLREKELGINIILYHTSKDGNHPDILEVIRRMEIPAAPVATSTATNTPSTNSHTLPNSATNQVHLGLPYQRNPFFTGRETELAAIDQALAKQGRVALVGLGGIGKTAIAIEYAHRHRKNHPDKHIFWVLADSDINIDNSFITIADELKLPRPNDQKPEDTVKQVQAWLKNNPNWLVIFDNLENLATLKKYLPTPAKGKVLITTRLADTEYLANIEIKKFGELDGVKFLLNCAKITAPTANDRQFAAKLVQELDGLPLALEQAGAYIAKAPLSIQRYLQLYRVSALLAKPSGSSIHDTVTVTFKLLFDKLKKTNAVAADLLQFMAFLAPDTIPEEIFKLGREHLSEKLQTAIADELDWDDVCAAATRYSLIKRDATSKSFSVHRLVQLVIREMLAEDEQRQWLESVVTVLVAVAQEPDKVENWPLCARLVPHQQMLFEHIQHYQLFNEASGAMLNQAGYYLYAQGQYQQAKPLYQQGLEIRKQVLGTLHPDYAKSLNNLAGLYYYQGRYELAEPLMKQALEIRKQVLGTDHPAYAQSLNNLAFLYKSQGRYELAEPLMKQALEIRKQVLGTNHPDYAQSLNNLAGLYYYQGRYELAEPLYQQALAITKQELGTNHPDYARSLNNLALLYYYQGRYEQAAPLLKLALAITKQELGTNHPDYATSLNNLALLYKSQGRYEQAEPLMKEALEIRKQVLGTLHPAYATSLNNLAFFYEFQGRYEQAEPLYREDLEIKKQVLGTLHPDYATSLNNLALLYESQGRYEQAELLLKEASEVYKQVQGTLHPDYAQSLNNLARLYYAQGQYNQAISLIKQVLSIWIKTLPPEHPHINIAFNDLRHMFIKAG